MVDSLNDKTYLTKVSVGKGWDREEVLGEKWWKSSGGSLDILKIFLLRENTLSPLLTLTFKDWIAPFAKKFKHFSLIMETISDLKMREWILSCGLDLKEYAFCTINHDGRECIRVNLRWQWIENHFFLEGLFFCKFLTTSWSSDLETAFSSSDTFDISSSVAYSTEALVILNSYDYTDMMLNANHTTDDWPCSLVLNLMCPQISP